MNNLSPAALERRKLRQLIRKYSKLDYEIYADYEGHPKPDKIRGFTPDLVLKKGKQVIIIEITTRRSPEKLGEKFEQLARYAKAHENVRFDIILTNPKPRLSKEEKQASKEVLLDDLQSQLLREAKELYEMGYYQASFLMLNVLLENILRALAIKKKAIKTYQWMPKMEISSLLRNNRIISEENFSSILRFNDLRMKVVHESYRPGKQTLRIMLDFITHLIDRVG